MRRCWTLQWHSSFKVINLRPFLLFYGMIVGKILYFFILSYHKKNQNFAALGLHQRFIMKLRPGHQLVIMRVLSVLFVG